MRDELRRLLVFSILFSFCIAGVAPAVADYYVQVSSQSSEAKVVAAYKSLQSLFPNELGNRQPLIHRADLGYKGTFFRAMVGPFTSSQEAVALCSNIMAAGGQCLIQSDNGPPPEIKLNTPIIKQSLLAQRKTLWKDPDSIRDARIGEPYACPRHGGFFSGSTTTCICIELNAKNSYGGYTGVQKKVVVYTGSTVAHIKDWDFDDHCEALTSFPEFNGGYTPPAAVSKPNKPQRVQ